MSSTDVEILCANNIYCNIDIAWQRWSTCHRWYKWLSILQLIFGQVMYSIGSMSYLGGKGLWISGSCCYSTGQAMGYSVTQEWQRGPNNEEYLVKEYKRDEGLLCKIFAATIYAYAIILLVVGVLCISLSFFFIFLTGTSCYEEVQHNGESFYFVLDQAWIIASTGKAISLKIHADMDSNSPVVGQLANKDIFYAQHVYTGWLRLTNKPTQSNDIESQQQSSSNKNVWVCYQPYGKTILKEFGTLEKAQNYLMSFDDKSTASAQTQGQAPRSEARIHNPFTTISDDERKKSQPEVASPIHGSISSSGTTTQQQYADVVEGALFFTFDQEHLKDPSEPPIMSVYSERNNNSAIIGEFTSTTIVYAVKSYDTDLDSAGLQPCWLQILPIPGQSPSESSPPSKGWLCNLVLPAMGTEEEVSNLREFSTYTKAQNYLLSYS